MLYFYGLSRCQVTDSISHFQPRTRAAYRIFFNLALVLAYLAALPHGEHLFLQVTLAVIIDALAPDLGSASAIDSRLRRHWDGRRARSSRRRSCIRRAPGCRARGSGGGSGRPRDGWKALLTCATVGSDAGHERVTNGGAWGSLAGSGSAWCARRRWRGGNACRM